MRGGGLINKNIESKTHIVFIDEFYGKELKETTYSECRVECESSLNNYENHIVDKIKLFFPNTEPLILRFGKLTVEGDNKILKEFRRQILDKYSVNDEIFFNLNLSNLTIQSFIFNLAREIDSNIYLITKTSELIFFPTDKKELKGNDDAFLEKEFNIEKILLDSLQLKEVKECGKFDYKIDDNIIYNTLLCSREILDNVLLFKSLNLEAQNYEAIKLIKITGIKLTPEERLDNKNVYLRNVFEGLSYFGSKIIRLILNNKKGIHFYFGLIVSGKGLNKIFLELESKLPFVKNLLVSILPGIEIEELIEEDVKNVLNFIGSRLKFGEIIGHTTVTTTNKVLRELENSLQDKKWGLMTISESLSQKQTQKIIDDLESEITSITPKHIEHIGEDFENKLFKLLKERKTSEWRIKNQYFNEITKIVDYVESNKSYGLWNTCNYIFAENNICYDTIYSIMKSNYKSTKSFWNPVKIIKLDDLLSQFPKNFQQISINKINYNISDEFKFLNTIYSSHRLGDYIHLPTKSLNNFKIIITPKFKTELPETVKESMYCPLKVGIIKGSNNRNNDFYIDSDSLKRHCLVMGSTGSGKTNTIINILLNLRKKEKSMPFLIIEPIKKEFRQLLNYFDDLKIYTAGSSVNPLKINLLEVPSFLSYSQWVNELLELFCTSFYIWEPLRGAILNCLNELYQLNGWTEESRGRTPNLEEFLKFMKLRNSCTNYTLKTRMFHRAAFENRFESMIKGARGLTFNTTESRPSPEELLNKPIIIELDGLRNDDERALVFNYVLNLLYLYQQENGLSKHLRHVTVIEEAHRLLSTNNTTGDPQLMTISMKSQEKFSDILAEIRTYGEGIIISEQKPQQLHSVAITNTNNKICHKLPSKRQIENFKDTLGLTIDQLPYLTRLKPGECFVSIDGIDDPYLIQMNLVKNEDWGIVGSITDEHIKKHNSTSQNLEQLHYMVVYDENSEEFLINITELIYIEKGIQKKIVHPKKKDCLKFSNFDIIFWNQMKEFYLKYTFCPTCIKVFPFNNKVKCLKCNTSLRKIKKMKVPLFGSHLNTDIIMKHVKLDELYDRLESLIPDDNSSRYRTEHAKIKRELINILENNSIDVKTNKTGLGSLF